jgi:hypothetical protein
MRNGATNQSRSGRSGQGPNGTAPGRRPFRGVAGTASVLNAVNRAAHVWPISLKQEPMLTHRFALSAGLVWPALCSDRSLRGPRRNMVSGTLPNAGLSLLEKRAEGEQKTGSAARPARGRK